MAPHRLAIVTSHPIQYYAPWFADLARQPGLELKVFYLWDFGVKATLDREFGQVISWDIPLLEGYAHEFVPNTARDPGTHHFFGLRNPTLTSRLDTFAPDAVLLLSYSYLATIRLILGSARRWRLLFRGDSHRLTPRRGPFAWLKRQLTGLVFARFSACLYVGEANRRYFLAHGVNPERLWFAPHAIDTARFAGARSTCEAAAAALRQKLNLTEQDRLAIFVGKFEWQKDLSTLLAAFAKVSNPRFHLLLVGEGPLRAQLLSSAPARTHFMGFQNQSAMPSVYAAGDVLVLPSISETWGLVVNEALAAGTPVIVSDQVGCHFDLVEDGKSGFVVRAGDAPAFAVALERLLSDDALREKFRMRGSHISQAYTYDRATDGLMRALDL